MQTTKMHSLEELEDARDAGKVIEEAYYSEGMLTPKGYAVNPIWNKRFTKSLDRYRIVDYPQGKNMKKINEITVRKYITGEVIDTLCNVYKIDRYYAMKYVGSTHEFMDNVMDRIDEAMTREVEEFISSSDILKHQK